MEKTKEIFDIRNIEKQKIEFLGKKKLVKVGQIWIGKVGANIGNEISKDLPFNRPFLVLGTGFGGDLVYGCWLTTKFKEKYPNQYYQIPNGVLFGLKENIRVILN